jgi:hypothetical protein
MLRKLMTSNFKSIIPLGLLLLSLGFTSCNNQKSDKQMLTTVSPEKIKHSSSNSALYQTQSNENETECYKMRVYFSLFKENAKIYEESALEFDRLDASDDSGFHFNRIWARSNRQLAEIERAKAQKIYFEIAAKCGG